MIIPHLHFNGNCNQAITFYEKAFNTKAEIGDRNGEFISHAIMDIRGTRVFLNDRVDFANTSKRLDGTTHFVVLFDSKDELLDCYAHFGNTSTIIDEFTKESYSAWCGNFMDEFGVVWGFMVR